MVHYSMLNSNTVAVFGGGCFWCTEAIFQELKGVVSVVPGYAGGAPTTDGEGMSYEEVSSGKTGHAEVIKIDFDPAQISYHDLLTVFFATHDSSTPNRQGADVGTQYRSIILTMDETQRREAENFINELNNSTSAGAKIVTEIKPLTRFYEAEEYHRDYYKNNSNQPYCQLVINPKLQKMQERFYAILKK